MYGFNFTLPSSWQGYSIITGNWDGNDSASGNVIETVEDSIINHQNHYRICRDEIECDYELFEEAAEKFRLQKSDEAAQIILSLYKGEYLADFESFWATAKRIRYHKIYEQAMDFAKTYKNQQQKPFYNRRSPWV